MESIHPGEVGRDVSTSPPGPSSKHRRRCRRILQGVAAGAAVAAAVFLGLEFGPLMGIPALIGFPALILSFATAGREIGEAPQLALSPDLPPAIAAYVLELEVITDELDEALTAPAWGFHLDCDLLQRFENWLHRGETLGELDRDWLSRRGAHHDSLRASSHSAQVTADGKANRDATRSLRWAIAEFGRALERDDGTVGPYR